MYEYAKKNYNAIFKSMGGQICENTQKGYNYQQINYYVYLLNELPRCFLGQNMAVGYYGEDIVEKYEGSYWRSENGNIHGNGAVVCYDANGEYTGWGEWRDFVGADDLDRRVCFLREN